MQVLKLGSHAALKDVSPSAADATGGIGRAIKISNLVPYGIIYESKSGLNALSLVMVIIYKILYFAAHP
jgi:hypothetical protein